MIYHSRLESIMEKLRTTKPVKMRVECSWKYPGCIGVMEKGDEGAPTSHGICESCAIIWNKIAEDRMAV
jgi:hypothetical protein